MHIVLVIDQYDNLNNGTTATARRYAKELRKRGNTVTILSGGVGGEDKIGVPVRRIPIFQPLVEKQGFSFAKASDEAYYQAFRDADIVHFYLPTPFCRRGEEIARQMRIPIVAAFHLQPENVTYSLGLGKNRRANEALYRYFYFNFYNRFRYIHCPSRFIAGQLEQREYGANLCVISNGVDDSFKPQPPARHPQFEGKFVILMIGRLSGEKRQDLVIEAAGLSRYRDRIQLVFAGRGPKEKQYRRLGRSLPNAPVFGFYPQEELIQLINSSDLYVHASDAEIEGISCMEAMACGVVPVISDSRLSAAKDFALDDRSLFRAGDAASLAGKIDHWIEHSELLAEQGKRYAEKADGMRVGDCVAQAEAMYRAVIDDYRKNGYRQAVESPFRRMSHPDADHIHSAYAETNFFRQFLFSAFTNFLSPILYMIDTIFFGLRIQGRHLLRQVENGAVTVSNHVHPMDCTMIKLAVFPRRIYFTSLRRNLELPFVGFLTRACGALPLPVDPHGMIAFQKLLRQGIFRKDWIHFYPEGLLVRNHTELRDFHAGAFFTAVVSECPVVPMVITYGTPKGIWRLIGPKEPMNLLIGEPQYPLPALPRKEAVQELENRTRAVMQEMRERPLQRSSLNLSVGIRVGCVIVVAVQLLKMSGLL